MIKHISLLLTLIISTTHTAPPDQKPVIFLWDLHHVLLKPAGKIKALINYPYKKLAFKNANLRRKFLKYSLISRFKEVSSEKFLALGDQYNNPYFKEMILAASAAQEPMQPTIEILQELKKNGYTHHVGSNMGITTFNALTNPEKYPQFAPIFNNFELDKSQVVTLKTDTFKKPNVRFFERYLKNNNLDPNRTRIIFIDDLKKNVNTARKAGLEGIRFKNAKQLRADLVTMGINIAPDTP